MYDESKSYIIRKQVKEHIEDYDKRGLYTIFNSQYVKKIMSQEIPCYKLSQYFNLFWKCDKSLAITKEVGEEIENLINDVRVHIGLYNIQLNESFENSNLAKTIFQKGLEDTENTSLEKISDQIIFPKTIVQALLTLKDASQKYEGCFVFAFPKALINDSGNLNMHEYHQIYDCFDGITYIKPEYIIGYIDTDSKTINYIPKEEIIAKTKTLKKTPF